MSVMDVVLGIDTSCYTTSVAAANRHGQVIGSHRMLLPVSNGERGLRQSEAVFAHIKQLPLTMKALSADLEREHARICAVAASSAPREDAESYMPVFVTGMSQANGLAHALRVPCYSFSHQQGHIAAGQIDGKAMDDRFVALHLSGGTTDLLLSDNGKLKQLGGTLDLNAGQLVDRVGVAMGLPFPAGPALEALAAGCSGAMGCPEAMGCPTATGCASVAGFPVKPKSVIPVSMEQGDLCCHFSGAEAKCKRMLAEEALHAESALSMESIALEVFDFLARTVTRLIMAGCAKENVRQALVVGGVASSSLLRDMLEARLRKAGGTVGSPIEVVFGRPEYSGDNAAGIAVLGVRRYLAAS